MAQQRMVIEVQPTPALEQMLRRILADQGDTELEAVVAGDHPDTQRFLFVDSEGEPHWPLRSNIHAALAKSWRQAFVKKVGQ
jgi:hypothetical protein